MSSYREGQRVQATTAIHRSSGSAWPGDKSKIIKVAGDGVVVQWDNGAHTDVVEDNEINRA
jgi:hypothetical protein